MRMDVLRLMELDKEMESNISTDSDSESDSDVEIYLLARIKDNTMMVVGKVRYTSVLKLKRHIYPETLRFTQSLECRNPLIRNVTNRSENVQYDPDYSDTFIGKYQLTRSTEFVRNVLYPDTNDEIITQLKQCQKAKDVLNIVDSRDLFSLQQLIQAVLILRDLQSVREVSFEFQAYSDQQLTNEIITEHASFKKLVQLLEGKVPEMNASEASCSLLYLFKLHVDLNEPLMVKLMSACEELTRNGSSVDVPIIDVARWFVVVMETRSLWSLYTMKNYMPFVLHKLEHCDDVNEFRHVTVCLQKMTPLLNSCTLKKYNERCEFLLRKKEDVQQEMDRIRTTLKSVLFLSYNEWCSSNKSLIRRLLRSLVGSLQNCSVQELVYIHRTAYSLQEPYDLLKEIKNISANWLQQFEESRNSLLPYVLNIRFPSSVNSVMYEDLRNCFKHYFHKPVQPHEFVKGSGNLIFLYGNTNLKQDKEMMEGYWWRIRKVIQVSEQDLPMREFFRYCYSYLLYLNNSNSDFDKNTDDFFQWKLNEYLEEEKTVLHSPSTYTKLVLTYLALGGTPLTSFNDKVHNKVLEYITRLSIHEHFYVSLALLLIMRKLQSSDRKRNSLMGHCINLMAAINRVSLQYLQNTEHIQLDELNSLLYTFSMRKRFTKSELLNKICDKYEKLDDTHFCSKSIREALISLGQVGRVLPSLLNKCVDYCIREENNLNGYTVSTVLNTCFLFGFIPDKLNEFLDVAKRLVERDEEDLVLPIYVRSALAFVYFNEFPDEWCDRIFNINFLRKLDASLEQSTPNVNANLQEEFMELNRGLCVEYPHREVPWFHDQYCKEKINARRTNREIQFKEEVARNLKNLVQMSEAIKTNHLSPYQHQIDILLHLDRSGSPVDPKKCKETDLRRVGLMLLKTPHSFSYFKGKGKLELHVRQLEMLNYRVVTLHQSQWDSVNIAEPNAKEDYLKRAIWSN